MKKEELPADDKLMKFFECNFSSESPTPNKYSHHPHDGCHCNGCRQRIEGVEVVVGPNKAEQGAPTEL